MTPERVLSPGVPLFYWVRLKRWTTGARELRYSPLKLTVLLIVWSVLLAIIYALSYRGIRFVNDTAGLGPFLLSRLWFLFLFVVMILLAVSQLTNGYSTMVRAPETRYWMTLPVSARTLCRAKWLESSAYSSWAVILLALPLCLAYLVVLDKPLWLAAGMVGALLVPLTGIVTALATALLLVWLRWCSRIVIRRELIPVGFVLACAALFWILGEQRRESQQDVWFVALQGLLPRMRLAMSMWMPSSWVATALDDGLNGRWVESGCFALLLWTTMLVCWRLLDHVAAGLLFPVLRQHVQAVEASGVRVRSRRVGEVAGCARSEAGQFRVRWWMGRPLLAMFAKDVLLVIRDPMQWSQAVVFFGLLGAYFANIHRLTPLSVEPSWRIGVASLNLACTLLVFGSLSVRFIFPQMSLEGRSLWILRMAGRGTRHLLVSKLCLYGALAVLVTEGLLAMSAQRLGVPVAVRWWLASVGVVASFTMVGLAVGLGAWWIDPTVQDAARLVSSSKGALVLVLMLGYVGCVVATLVAVWTNWLSHPLRGALLASLGLLAVSLVVGGVPLLKGVARLQQFEES